MNKLKKTSLWELLFGLVFVALCGFLFRRLPYGAAMDDEAFYLTVPWQLLQGSAPVLHQWNTAQLFGLLLCPLLRLYLLLNPSAEGIFLHFRALYLLLHALVSLLLWLRLRNRDRLGAAAVSLIYLQFVFRGLPCLSYNTMGVGLLLIAGLTLGLSPGKAWEYLTAGLAFAGAVLCCPYLAVLWPLYGLAALFLAVRKKAGVWDGVFALRSWLLFTAGCAVLAALFFLRMARYGDLRLLPGLLPMLFEEDPNHLTGALDFLRAFYTDFSTRSRFFKPILLGSALLTAAILLDRGREKRRWLYLLAAVGLSFLWALPYLLMYRSQNAAIFPLSILGFFAFLLCRKKESRLFAFLYLPGVVYWVCIDMASDLGFSSIAGASAVNMPLCVLSLVQLLRELWEDRSGQRPLRRAAAALSGLLACALTAALVLTSLYATHSTDANGPERWKDDTVIACGAARGLIAHDDEAAEYTAEYAALAPLREIPEGNVLYLARNSLRFLEDPKRCVSNNLWFAYSGPERAFSQLETYWALFPDRRPDFVYLTNKLTETGYLEIFSPLPHTETDVGTGVILTMDWSTS